MVLENEFHEILEKKGMVEQCRQIWWKQWKTHQDKFGGSREALENLVIAAIKNGCKAPCSL
ncbi:MAG: hypothetical protein A2Z62_00765 [Candidatus Terrybacteria bacterium RIFCSPLOWO2_02_42_20]|uniref:Uncharacterized protein n=2 Tax=Candidatus Terryibacteriota TaxID=1817920 RepID=A0A1G2PMT4_9BACT|nr:MAG: hypothetical protein A2W59_00650 [Candidatus Terrybacteria bacterium RIFCSPHIGHO2_02_41_19]OHA54420.1 MAG: hypothetical protein A2Z62_00765 [Candidatus Terrybacteria bacterium RIFCSPLOWO2_02_42_20]